MKCQVLIDWLTFSVKEKDPNKVIQIYLGMDPALFRLLASDVDANVSRIDIACDDRAGHWVRVELVMRSKNANAFVEQMTTSEDVGKLAAQVMNDKFSFIERDDSNITRCTVCSWWRNFVDELESVRLAACEVIQHTVEQIGNWVEAQVGPSLAILFQTMGWPYIFEIAKDAASRLSDKQISLVSDYNSLQYAQGVV